MLGCYVGAPASLSADS